MTWIIIESQGTNGNMSLKDVAVLVPYGLDTSVCLGAYKAGAALCLFYSPTESLPYIQGLSQIPSLLTTHAAATALRSLPPHARKVTVSLTDVRAFRVPSGGTVSGFSSGGLGPQLEMKPDVCGIGGKVYSTVSPFASKKMGAQKHFAVLDGTSMVYTPLK
jgi:hypothetical protein